MIVTKMCLPRRTFLRGMGAALALPFLDAMVPALSALPAAATRLGFFYVPNGMSFPYWKPKDDGPALEITPILKPIEFARDQLTVITGLGNFTAEGGGGPHTRSHVAWLSGVGAKRTEGADVEVGVTADQIAAQELGKDTQLLSLEIALEPNYVVGNCDNGYSCTYSNTFSWRNATTPNPMESNPRAVFERLFGDGGPASARLTELRRDRSILDSVTGEMSSLGKKLGARDRSIVAEYLQAVREVEERIQKAEKQNTEAPVPVGGKPVGIPEQFDDHAKLMLDLVHLAYQADITRVVAFQISREQTNRAYPFIGVPEAHHGVSHHQNNPVKFEQCARINTYHMGLFAHLLEKMRRTPDGDATLLDRSMLMYGSGLGDGDLHSPLDLPVFLVGGGSGRLKGNRHIKMPLKTPMTNMLISLLDKVGVTEDKLGDSTGAMAEL